MEESEVQAVIQIYAPKHKCQLLRNNSGAFTDSTGRHVRYGLGNVSKKHSDSIKSSDLIGFRQVVITPEMVGKTVAVFTAIEVKRPEWIIKSPGKDKRQDAQCAFLEWIRAAGGFAGFASSVEDFKKIIGS